MALFMLFHKLLNTQSSNDKFHILLYIPITMEQSDENWEELNISECDNITISQLERISTQEFVVIPIDFTSKRFDEVTPHTALELEVKKQDRLPKNTLRQDSWARLRIKSGLVGETGR
jgi:hypothetical protein